MLQYKQLEFNPNYFISNKGFLISFVGDMHIVRPGFDKNGYTKYCLRNIYTKEKRDYKGHRLVAYYFIDNPNNLPCVNHKDGNKANNTVENLEWVTHTDNNLHAYNSGLSKPKCHKVEYNGIIYSSKSEAAKQLNVSRATIVNWIKKGKIKVISS